MLLSIDRETDVFSLQARPAVAACLAPGVPPDSASALSSRADQASIAVEGGQKQRPLR
jgi:hypothetical protein